MTHNSKYLIIDLEIVREKGFEYFVKSEKWPVSENDFHEFSDFVRSLYNRLVSSVDDSEVLDIALVESVFVNQMVNIFHYNYVDKYCKINNIKLIGGGNKSSHYLNPAWSSIGEYYSNLTASYNKVTRFFRNKVKNIVFNNHLSFRKMVYGFFIGSEVVGIGSNDRIKQDYVINNNLFCDNKDGYALIDNALAFCLKNNSDSIHQFSELVSEKIIEPFMYELCTNDSLFVKGIDCDAIKKAWLQRFLDAYKIYKGLFLITCPKTLLVTEVGKPHSKLITLVFQRRGCKVFNFHHGNDSVLVNQYWVYQTLFNHCDNYVVDTKKMCERFKVLNNNEIYIRNKVTRFISVDSDYYSELRKSIHSVNCKKIMLMGYPMNLDRYPDEAYLFFHYKLKLEYMLADIISSSGYHVTYKSHPDRLEEIGSIMLDVSDRIIGEPFENVWRSADVLIFTYVPTTTFCYALNLPIPIVLIEIPGTPWYKNMREVVENRVSILTAQMVDERIVVDKNELLGKISEACNKIYQDVAIEVTG